MSRKYFLKNMAKIQKEMLFWKKIAKGNKEFQKIHIFLNLNFEKTFYQCFAMLCTFVNHIRNY